MATITIKKLRKQFESIEVLKNIDLEMAEGEFVVLVGPSGCGKSTLLRTIAGLESASSGDIYIADTRVNDLPPKDRDISMVFQSYALYPHMSVARNMGFSLEVQKQPRQEIDKAVERAAKILGLTHLLQRKPKELSGGQRQRVAMGRAIVRQPKVFLFDEPLSNLDAQLRVQMRLEIKALHQKMRSTIVYVTHDQVEAMTLADRIVVLNGGIVQQVGAPLAIYDRPENVFVASFMGAPAMNFLTGVVQKANSYDSESRVVITAGGLRLPIPSSYYEAEIGQQVICGIRPEHLSLQGVETEARGMPAPAIPLPTAAAKVIVVEPTGISEQIYCEIEGVNCCIYSMQRTPYTAGDDVTVMFDPQQIHLFDAKSEARLLQRAIDEASERPLGANIPVIQTAP